MAASGHLASQQPFPHSTPQTAHLMQHQQPAVDHLTTFHSFNSCYLFKLQHPEILLKAPERLLSASP